MTSTTSSGSRGVKCHNMMANVSANRLSSASVTVNHLCSFLSAALSPAAVRPVASKPVSRPRSKQSTEGKQGHGKVVRVLGSEFDE